jgi:hypothetical protein
MFKIRSTMLSLVLLGLMPTVASAECLQGPNLVVNEGHGASITFDEPVYQAKLFDVSRLILNEIPETGSETLILTAVDAVQFPGLPSGPQTSLLATTATGCYVFRLSVGQGNFHASVNATEDEADLSILSSGLSQPLNIENLRIGLANAEKKVGAENSFVIRVNQFLSLVDDGVSQRAAAQRLQIQWDYLTTLADVSSLDHLLQESVSQ